MFRQARRKNSTGNIDSRTYEVEMLIFVMASIVTVGAGVLFAHVCAFFIQPACLNKVIVDDAMLVKKDTTTTAIITKEPKNHHAAVVSVSADPAPGPPPPDFPPSAKFPPSCTKDQYSILRQQLPSEGCERFAKTPWRHNQCSFSEKTLCGTTNPHWVYDFWQASEDPFVGIFVGCNKAYDAVETLRIVGKDPKYDLDQWSKAFVDGANEKVDESVQCPNDRRHPRGKRSSAKVYCIEGYPKTFQRLQDTKAALGYSDDEMEFLHFVASKSEQPPMYVKVEDDPIGAMDLGIYHWKHECRKHLEKCKKAKVQSLNEFIASRPELKSGTIQYLSITAEGSDYDILQGTSENLARIEYLDFGYHWNWEWGKASLKELIFKVKRKGFVCYFASATHDLWRITDCWQDHYDFKFPASIACVNANLPSAEPLLNHMESIFQKGLQTTPS